eukprot:1559313-Lingulodinium_polyedra.AAC.1
MVEQRLGGRGGGGPSGPDVLSALPHFLLHHCGLLSKRAVVGEEPHLRAGLFPKRRDPAAC